MTTTQTGTTYRRPVYSNAISFSCRCASCGAALRPGDIAKVYSRKLEEPRASHLTNSNGSPRAITHQTVVYGVTRHDDKGKPIACHEDTRQTTTNAVPATAPSQVNPQTAQPDLQALVAQAVQQALGAILPQPQQAVAVESNAPRQVRWDPNVPVDGRSGVVKAFLDKFQNVSLAQLKREAPTGYVTID